MFLRRFGVVLIVLGALFGACWYFLVVFSAFWCGFLVFFGRFFCE